jgi:hypothetical protein
VKCAFELQNIWSHSQSWWCASFWHSFKCNYAITSVIAMFQRITPNEDMKMSFKCNIVPQSVLVVYIFSTFIYIQSCVHIGR